MASFVGRTNKICIIHARLTRARYRSGKPVRHGIRLREKTKSYATNIMYRRRPPHIRAPSGSWNRSGGWTWKAEAEKIKPDERNDFNETQTHRPYLTLLLEGRREGLPSSCLRAVHTYILYVRCGKHANWSWRVDDELFELEKKKTTGDFPSKSLIYRASRKLCH